MLNFIKFMFFLSVHGIILFIALHYCWGKVIAGLEMKNRDYRMKTLPFEDKVVNASISEVQEVTETYSYDARGNNKYGV